MYKFTSKTSIKRRVLTILIMCSVVVLGCTAIAQVIVTHIANNSAKNIELRQSALSESRNLRTNLRVANDLLTDHLLRPSPDVRTDWQKKISEIMVRTNTLTSSSWIQDNNLTTLVNKLRHSLLVYDQEVMRLIDVRMNADKQHPALFYARETMLPQSKRFTTAASLALEEILEGGKRDMDISLYESIIGIRHLWVQIISSFRMNLINRLGSFSEEVLRSQETDITVQYQVLATTLTDLIKNKDKLNLGIQTEASLEMMLDAAAIWFKDYKSVKTIHASPNWRMDVEIINKTIRPLDKNILGHLQDLEYHISDSAADDVSDLARMGEAIILALWSLMVAGWIIAALGFVYFNRSVLQPIAILTKAIKAEASETQRIMLPDIESEETQNLIEAFSMMRRQIHTRQTALEHQALHDALTGLPNRNLLFDRVKQYINNVHRENGTLGLLMLDLDRFKEINDTLGHQVGDRILEQVSLRLTDTLRDTDTVARLGGDEFAMAVPLKEPEHAEIVANKILTSLEKPFVVEGYQLYVGGSIGVSLYPKHGDSVETLLQRADVAMYVAKRNNSGHKIYEPMQDKDSLGQLALSNDLRNAINKEELMVYYQPKLDLKTGLTRGVEALIRWNHPERGFVSPDQIIYIAEHTGLIKPLTRWVLKTAISQCSHWHKQGLYLSIAVNLSTQNLQDPGLSEVIQSALTTYNFPAEYLVLEVTESAMMVEPEHANEILSHLDAMGVWISIDDFGTGFSSLAYLKQLPVDELKIDKSFVINMQSNENDAVIVRSTIDLARNLGLKVVAEGIEDSGTWEVLSILGCDYAQGFYMSKPLPAADFEVWVKDEKTRASVSV